ncbi:hypothetical protein F4808DRAFT_466029 [Astrocystis sublimbata]|nr:hypothetical protein F4808DRAFT_466029 [Astrocystis sublimbata]
MVTATDVTKGQSVQDLVRDATREFNRVDIMVNNAGIAPEASTPKPIWETIEAEFDAVQQVNVRGVFLGCKYGGAQMMRQWRLSPDIEGQEPS